MIRAEQITPSWLTDRLREKGHLLKGCVEDGQIGKEFESTAAFLTPLKITYFGDVGDSLHRDIILKRYREDWFGGGLSESTFYNDIATRVSSPPKVRCYDFDFERSTRQCYFLLVDASHTHNIKPPKGEAFAIDLFKQIIDSILKFHVGWWDAEELQGEDFLRASGGPLCMIHASTTEVVKGYCRAWREKEFTQFTAKFSSEVSQEKQELIRKSIDAWEKLYPARIKKARGLTLLHGDLHKYNIFYPKDASKNTLYFSDWETFKRGIGTYDLCYLVADEEPDRRRSMEEELLRYYHDGLMKGGISGYSWDDCASDYRLTVMANLFPTLVWKRLPTFNSRMEQFLDWNCQELLL
jgi:thiamine kinase-like enzyme